MMLHNGSYKPLKELAINEKLKAFDSVEANVSVQFAQVVGSNPIIGISLEEIRERYI